MGSSKLDFHGTGLIPTLSPIPICPAPLKLPGQDTEYSFVFLGAGLALLYSAVLVWKYELGKSDIQKFVALPIGAKL